MSYYSIWGRREKEKEKRGPGEKAWRREGQEPWEAKWQALSAQARFCFLDVIKGPARKGSQNQPNVATDKLPPRILAELVAAGFVEVRSTRVLKANQRVFAVQDVHDFAIRVRSLRRYHLLATGQSSELEKFVKYCYEGAAYDLVSGVLRAAGIQEHYPVEEALQRYVAHRRWPGWVAKHLKDPLAEPLLAAVQQAEGPIPLGQLPPGLAKKDAAKVRATLDKLVVNLALFEDLRPETWELVVDLLPSVREDLAQADKPRPRPPLQVCAQPREFGPEGGLVVNDLRGFLLELAGEPARLRQDRALFQKDADRIGTVLEPVPAWFESLLHTSVDGRLDQALRWARDLKLVKEKMEGGRTWLHLSSPGHAWLAQPLELQYGSVYDFLRPLSKKDAYDYSTAGDGRFLGVQVMVVKATARTSAYLDYWNVKPEQIQALRDALDRAFSELPHGVFHRWDSVREHLTFGQHNPLLLGLEQDQVAVYWESRPVPALEEQREEAGQLLLDEFARHRLIPLGGLRVAVDAEGKLCVARHPRLDAYFGRKVDAAAVAGPAAAESRVIVQPDFSIVIIGLNPAPAAELAPFCERSKGAVGQGAMILKITRETVVKAVTHGLGASEIVARLRRHASNELPANVLKEVQGWCAWVRRVEASHPTLLRCPDRDTADRAAAALGKPAERLNETTLVIPAAKLAPADRQKLLNQGLIVHVGEEPAEPRRVVPKKRKRRW